MASLEPAAFNAAAQRREQMALMIMAMASVTVGTIIVGTWCGTDVSSLVAWAVTLVCAAVLRKMTPTFTCMLFN
jgi:hypothetical protein